jgi:type VI secretion system protein ImpH
METMASYGWRDRRSVEDALFTEGHRFSFVQAVRLLEEMRLRGNRTAPAEGADPDREVVHFRHAVRLDFPPTDIEEVTKPSNGDGPVEMTVNVLGLAGALGPLPPAVSELIVERAFRKDTAFRDFLDIFNHRLVSLLYRARKKYRPALDSQSPDRGRVASVLTAFLGLATPGLLGRMEMPDRALLPYTGLVVDKQRSTIGLVRLLEDYFEIAVTVLPFQGQWNEIQEDDLTYIGPSGMNQVLGRSAVLAKRIWDEEASVEVQLGPLTLDQFVAFLPIGRSHHALVAAVRYYLRGELGFMFRLQIAAGEVPELRIGRAEAAFLGWTTWLKTRPFAANDAQVRLRGRA